MGKKQPPLVIVEANDDNTYEAMAFYDRQQAADPHPWNRAVIHETDGLTIFHDAGGAGLHFDRLLCGYSGSGSIDAAKVLAKAGFGDFRKLKAQLSRGSRHSLTHPTNGR